MTGDLSLRFERNLDRLLSSESSGLDTHLLVAFSGGMDSTVLLHLLRYTYRRSLHLTAAHFDHRMRGESRGDALWCRGVCAAWGVPLIEGRADEELHGEEKARTRRYAFLRAAREEAGADWILTAHHADDQAETVLFRVLRGTGISGLRGIPERSTTGLLRPLLPFWREELREYADAAGIRWREDASNAGSGAARNRLRNAIIPQLEQQVAPGARRSLVRLSEIAVETEAAWQRQLTELRPRVVREVQGGFLVARHEIARYDPEIGVRLVRDVLRLLQAVPDRIGTRKILQFIIDAASGREKELPGGVRILIEHDSARFTVSPSTALPEREWVLDRPPETGASEGDALLGGRRYEVTAIVSDGRPATAPADGWLFAGPLSDLRFPLKLRARRPGDRIRLPGGSRSIKKLLIDRRVPLSERASVPVLVDSTESVLWVGGVASTVLRTAEPGELVLNLVLKR